MSEQTVDLRSTLSGLRRHLRVLIGAAVLGAALGIGSVVLWPPTYSSSSLVLLPQKAVGQSQMTDAVKTDVQIAVSDSVLGPAARSLEPPMSRRALARHVQVVAVTPLVLRISAKADDPTRAQQIARAVASSDVIFVTKSASTLTDARRASIATRLKDLGQTLDEIEVQIRATTSRQQSESPASGRGRADAATLAALTARRGELVLEIDRLRGETEVIQPSGGASVIQDASPATRAGLIPRYLTATLAGSLVAALIASALIVLLTRHNKRLHFRDEIADAVGSPVIASVRSRAPTSVAGWISLLSGYDPDTVDAWAWRQALRQLMSGQSRGSAVNDRGKAKMDHPRSIMVITISGDHRGLAAGPQIAAYATSIGLRTHLVAAQRHEAATTLWAACSSFEQAEASRVGLKVDTRLRDGEHVDFTVVLAVVDRQHPQVEDISKMSTVVLALSAGSATAEELARVAVAVDDADRWIGGVVVTDPDNLDRTTGRLLHHDRAQQAPLPTRLTGRQISQGRRKDAASSNRRQG